MGLGCKLNITLELVFNTQLTQKENVVLLAHKQTKKSKNQLHFTKGRGQQEKRQTQSPVLHLDCMMIKANQQHVIWMFSLCSLKMGLLLLSEPVVN